MKSRSLLLAFVGCAVALACLSAAEARASDAIDLKDVHALTFKRGKTTAGRRSAGVPQLSCVGGDASTQSYLVDAVQCVNTGEDDYGEVQWKCETDLDDGLRVADLNVNCEGYSSRTDRLKLRGSCGLEYTLHYTSSGKQRRSSGGGAQGYSTWNSGRGSAHHQRAVQHANYGDSSGGWASTILLIGMVGLLIVVCMREQSARPAAASAPGGGGDARPPPYNPNAGNTPNGGQYTSSQAYGRTGWTGGMQPPGGFWGGAAAGGMLASLFGNRGGFNRGYGGWGGGGWGGGGWGRPRNYGYGGYTGTGTGYRAAGASSGYSAAAGGSSGGTTRRQAGYAGTSTR